MIKTLRLFSAAFVLGFAERSDSRDTDAKNADVRKKVEAAGGKINNNRGGTIRTLSFARGESVDDALMAEIAKFTELELPSLNHPAITNKCLAHLRNLKHLRSITLDEGDITDAGLDELVGLTQLSKLDLMNTPIGDAGIQHLIGIPSLTSLGLFSTHVTDAGTALLADL